MKKSALRARLALLSRQLHDTRTEIRSLRAESKRAIAEKLKGAAIAVGEAQNAVKDCLRTEDKI